MQRAIIEGVQSAFEVDLAFSDQSYNPLDSGPMSSSGKRTGPDRLSPDRDNHGSPGHRRGIKDDIRTLRQAKVDEKSIRMNQSLVDGNGRKISNLRPDVQGYRKGKGNRKGTIVIYERTASQPKSAAEDKWNTKVVSNLKKSAPGYKFEFYINGQPFTPKRPKNDR